jgi:hypothetical protein
MPVPSIRGHQGRLKVFSNGAEAGVVNITSMEVNQDSSFSRSYYVGNQFGEGDQTIEGWSGSIDLEVKDDAEEVLIDALINANRAGIGVDEITIVADEFYPDGQISSYVYFDVQLRLSKRMAGLNEKVTKSSTFKLVAE